MKKITKIALALIIAFGCFTFSVSAGETIQSGSCGPSAKWSLDAEGTLTVTGTGKITKRFENIKTLKKNKINKIVVEDGITEIGDFAFLNINAESISISKTVVYICDYAFSTNSKLKNVQLSGGVRSLGDSVFSECESLESINLPDSIEEMGYYTFFLCEKLKNVRLPKNIEILPDNTFNSCSSLVSVEWPANLKKIGASAFAACTAMNKIVIPDTVEIIDKYAFDECENLNSITFGKSVKTVKKGYIRSCYAIKKIINNSSAAINVYTFKGRKKWYVDGKEVSKIEGGQEAYSKGKKVKIIYNLNGGKIKGKKVKVHIYGTKTVLPKAVKKGYKFIGWKRYSLCLKYIDRDTYKTVKLTAVFKKK